MIKILSVILTGIITSFYFFPFSFTAFPSQNTKNLLAAAGIVVFVLHFCRRKKAILNKDYLQIFALAAVFSLIVYFSVTVNGTPDMAYGKYIVSMIIWMSAAFVVCSMIHMTHRRIDVKLVCNYLIGVCVAQCVLALLIDQDQVFKDFVNSYIEQGQGFLDSKNVNRLYGIGASLDVAGSRFSAVLVAIAFLIVAHRNGKGLYLPLLIISLFVIAVAGNMIARTTTVGMLLALVYIFYKLTRKGSENGKLIYWILGLSLLMIPFLVVSYNNDPEFKKLIRFGFEGFVSIFEKGEWYTTSNESLANMIVFPDNVKTWLIGDGYFDNPATTDPYFIGEVKGGFYMGTDIGYLRFIFYCGAIGLITFIIYFIKVTQTCINRFAKYKVLFLMFLAVNMLVWLKVSTDIFLVFALFLAIPPNDNEEYDKYVAIDNEDTV